MRDYKRHIFCGLLAAGFCLTLVMAGAEKPGAVDPDKVEVIISPYGFAPSAKGKTGIDGNTVDLDLPISDSLDILELAGMLNVEVRRGRWGLLFDGVYMELEDDVSAPGPFFEHIDITFQQAWLDLGVAYRIFENDRGWVDLLAGGRYMYYSLEEDFSPDYGAVDEISDTIVDQVAADVRSQVEGAIDREVDALSSELAAQSGEVGDSARDKINNDVRTRVDTDRVHGIVQKEGHRIGESLEGPRSSGDLGDVVAEAFSERASRQVRDMVSAMDVGKESKALAAAMQRAMAERVERDIEAAGDSIKGDVEALKEAIHKSVSAKIDDLKREASAATRWALEEAEKGLAAKIDEGLQEAAEEDPEESIDWVDAYIGARMRWMLTERIYFGLRGDVGGFGIGSGSDLVWQLFGGVGYQCSERIAVEAGWRHFDMDYDPGHLSMDLYYSGATMGMSIAL